jgi:uncharacterized protein with PQ loop repeat
MYITSFLYLSCYVPELYANYKNKNANIYNIPEKVIMLVAASCGLSYAIVNNNIALVVNYAPILALDILALWMRVYYAHYQRIPIPVPIEIPIEVPDVSGEAGENNPVGQNLENL